MNHRGGLAARYAVLTATLFACAESNGGTPAAVGGAAGGVEEGGSGGFVPQGGRGNVGGACPGPASASDAGPPLSPADLGFFSADWTTREGHLSSVAADRIDITTPDGTHSFGWRGPALDAEFAVGDSVQLEATDGFGYGSRAYISTLRSSSATAVVVAGSPMWLLGVQQGSKVTVPDLAPELPELVYRLVSCCHHDGLFGITVRCDYSALEATLGGSSTAIPLGETGLIGPWSVTNLRSEFVNSLESAWDIQVTLLGPATPRSLDGGL